MTDRTDAGCPILSAHFAERVGKHESPPHRPAKKARCLILGCGTTLRSDDGVGPALCAWAEERFAGEPELRIIARQQWTPDLAEEVAASGTVIFIDCSLESPPGSVKLENVTPSLSDPEIATHHCGAGELLSIAEALYGVRPRKALQLTVGAGSIELGEQFSVEVQAAMADARKLLETTVCHLLAAELQHA